MAFVQEHNDSEGDAVLDDALGLIAERVPDLFVQVARVRRAIAARSPILHRRFDCLVQQAYTSAQFSAEERRMLADAVESARSTPQNRNYGRFIVSLPPGHNERLKQEAERLGIGRSELIRRMIDQTIPGKE